MVYPALVTVLIGLSTGPIARWVEIPHYPEHGTGRTQPVGEIIFDTIKFVGKTLRSTFWRYCWLSCCRA